MGHEAAHPCVSCVSAVLSLALRTVLFSPKCYNAQFPKTTGPPSNPQRPGAMKHVSLLTMENRLSPLTPPWPNGESLIFWTCSVTAWLGARFCSWFPFSNDSEMSRGLSHRELGVWSGMQLLKSLGVGGTSENNTKEYRKVSLLVDAFISRLHWIDVIQSVGEFNFISTPYLTII